MPKSKHNRKGKSRGGDRRPVVRSGKNEGPVDYRSALPPTTSGLHSSIEAPRRCPYLDRVAGLSGVFTKDECKKIIDNAFNSQTRFFLPHISLFYGNKSNSVKNKIISNLPSLKRIIKITNVCLALNEEKKLKWEIIEKFKIPSNN